MVGCVKSSQKNSCNMRSVFSLSPQYTYVITIILAYIHQHTYYIYTYNDTHIHQQSSTHIYIYYIIYVYVYVYVYMYMYTYIIYIIIFLAISLYLLDFLCQRSWISEARRFRAGEAAAEHLRPTGGDPLQELGRGISGDGKVMGKWWMKYGKR